MGADNVVLDGHKLAWHLDRVQVWERDARFAPVTVDMALTRACNYRCLFCYGQLQANPPKRLTWPVLRCFLDDAAEVGVRGVSLVSDGESTLNPHWMRFIGYGRYRGLSMALGTNGYLVTPDNAARIMPHLDYLRVNFSAGTPRGYARVMGVPESWFDRVKENLEAMVALKKRRGWAVTLGMQMVLMPHLGPEILPLAELALKIGVDYLIIKHCSDDEKGSLGIDYGAYPALYPLLEKAEAMSTPETRIAVKWSKIKAGNTRNYSRCYGPPFILQMSGSGLVAPCGMFFGERYKRFWVGNIATESFKDMVRGERYWEVMRHLASDAFDARKECGCLCLQYAVCQALDDHVKGVKELAVPPKGTERPLHVHFL